ncbi:SIS domain-containing protein [Luminiphilus sp.]|nr:SIS domain-containing protein [Luminiphilus sp.]
MTDDIKHFHDYEFTLENYIEEHNKVLDLIDLTALSLAVQMVVDAFENGKKIITCGNGGSASTASHYITDWSKMANLATGNKFRGFSLVDNVGLITAFGNDLSYDEVFSGQCRSVLDPGDLLLAVSGSGNSPNIIAAIEEANLMGAHTLGILGYDGGAAAGIADHSFIVPSFDMQVCEDIHLMFGHMVMKTLCGSPIRGVR